MGSLYYAQGTYAEAEESLKRAMAVQEKIFGSEYPGLAPILEHYAELLRKTNRENEGAKTEARAQAIRTKYGTPKPTKCPIESK